MIQVAVLWIINAQDEVLLAQRSHTKSSDPSTWGPAMTGKLEPGESFDEALAREVDEELGLTPDQYEPKFLFEHDFEHPDGETRRFAFYYAKLPRGIVDVMTIQTEEVEGVTWIKRTDALLDLERRPEELVPSAKATWPEILQALAPDKEE
jgi:8-oxo-dGTP pyrophosphatase MutT (NUDIX family)